jgi:hypothetical protein
MPLSWGLIPGLKSPPEPGGVSAYLVWQSCTGPGTTVEKARKIVLAFPTSYAKLLQGLAKMTVLSQRIFNGVG